MGSLAEEGHPASQEYWRADWRLNIPGNSDESPLHFLEDLSTGIDPVGLLMKEILLHSYLFNCISIEAHKCMQTAFVLAFSLQGFSV
jgi:hypothetical protein